MKNELLKKLNKLHQDLAAFKLSMSVMDANEFQKRINLIMVNLEEVIMDTKTLKVKEEKE